MVPVPTVRDRQQGAGVIKLAGEHRSEIGPALRRCRDGAPAPVEPEAVFSLIRRLQGGTEEMVHRIYRHPAAREACEHLVECERALLRMQQMPVADLRLMRQYRQIRRDLEIEIGELAEAATPAGCLGGR